LASFIALCSAALAKPVQSQLAVLGDMSLGGTIVQVRNLAESMQVAFDAGAKRILLPMSSVTDIPSVPGELFAKFQTSFLLGSGGCGVQGVGGGVGQGEALGTGFVYTKLFFNSSPFARIDRVNLVLPLLQLGHQFKHAGQ
jgi:hypothetical protein